ncbi:MAG: glycosyltransferase [Thermofilum sp.]|nr:glycosyltransferase [Thermofilum sp.]
MKNNSETIYLSIILVTHNNLSLLKTTLFSLINALRKLKQPIELIIIDNASTDETPIFLKQFKKIYDKDFPIIIIYNKINNHSYAVNLGVKIAKGKYILKIDDDIDIHEDAIVEALKIIENSGKIGSVQALWIKWDDSRIGYIHECDTMLNFRRIPVLVNKISEKYVEVPFPIIFFVIFRKDILNSQLMLDPWYHIAYDEVDFGFRLLELGYRNVIATRSLVRHKGPAKRTPDKYFYYEFRNRLATIVSHFPLFKALEAITLYVVSFLFVSTIRVIIFKDASAARCVIKSLVATKDLIINIKYLIQKRRCIKNLYCDRSINIYDILKPPFLSFSSLRPLTKMSNV